MSRLRQRLAAMHPLDSGLTKVVKGIQNHGEGKPEATE